MHKCRNPECHCELESQGQYCSEYCRRTVEYAGFDESWTGDAGCDCGHSECVHVDDPAMDGLLQRGYRGLRR